MGEEAARRKLAEALVLKGAELSQRINDAIFKEPEFQQTSDEEMLVGLAGLTGFWAKLNGLPLGDLIYMIEEAYKRIEGTKKPPAV